MKVREYIVLQNGRRVTVDMTNEEITELLSHAINLFISAGMMKINERPEVMQEMLDAEAQAQEETPSILVPGSESVN